MIESLVRNANGIMLCIVKLCIPSVIWARSFRPATARYPAHFSPKKTITIAIATDVLFGIPLAFQCLGTSSVYSLQVRVTLKTWAWLCPCLSPRAPAYSNWRSWLSNHIRWSRSTDTLKTSRSTRHSGSASHYSTRSDQLVTQLFSVFTFCKKIIDFVWRAH